MKTGKVYKATGEIYEISPKNGTDFQCDEIQEVVGGHFEMVSHIKKDGTREYMFVNEEGKLIGLELNFEASYLFEKWHDGLFSDNIAGDVLVCDAELVN